MFTHILVGKATIFDILTVSLLFWHNASLFFSPDTASNQSYFAVLSTYAQTYLVKLCLVQIRNLRNEESFN